MTQKKKLHDEIEKVAYTLFESSGWLHGHDLENWLEAEKIVMEKHEKHAKEIEKEIEHEADVIKKIKKGFRKTDKKGGRVYRD
ncbi:MAG: DUF2934 domain-containing protein [Thermodesulfovibrionales bacterium]|nr:DUF2934 domain-containing protein [Nitrospinota bacterium]MCG2814005.1 DUF2934 domain-containing protein [Thermodesulfovibrionales bacterium]MDP3049334.1 DUF2934 domain-containing protein [Thermodesulfovibrionales bacterium]